MGKESHRMRASIKPQVVQAADGFTARKMNFDIELDQSSQFEAYDFLMSPPKPPAVDTVDWANSQPVALRTLLLEVTKRPEKRAMKAETTWPSYVDDSFDPVASTSSDATSTKHRPLRRTNSSLRARLGPDSASHSSKPPPAPDDSFWGKDRHAILAVCQNVSERMDENAFLRADKAGDAGLAKRKVRQPHLTGVSKVKRASMPHHVAQRQETNRWDKGKQRENLVSEFKPQSTERRALLASSSSSSSSSSTNLSSPVILSSSLHLADASLTTDLDTSDASMMDIEPDHKPISASPSIYAVERKPSPISTRPNPSGHSAPTSTPRLHPLLTQHHRPNPPKAPPIPHNNNHLAPLPERPPLPHHNNVPPPLPHSQSARPPALGMRRVHTAPIPSQHALPMRQKGFKPPLRSQPAPQAKAQAPQHAKFARPSEGAAAAATSHHPSPAYPNPNSSRRSNTPKVQVQVQAKPAAPTRLDTPPDPAPPPAAPPRPLHTFHNARVASRDREQTQARPPSPEEANPDADSSFGDMSFDMDALEATMQMYD